MPRATASAAAGSRPRRVDQHATVTALPRRSPAPPRCSPRPAGRTGRGSALADARSPGRPPAGGARGVAHDQLPHLQRGRSADESAGLSRSSLAPSASALPASPARPRPAPPSAQATRRPRGRCAPTTMRSAMANTSARRCETDARHAARPSARMRSNRRCASLSVNAAVGSSRITARVLRQRAGDRDQLLRRQVERSHGGARVDVDAEVRRAARRARRGLQEPEPHGSAPGTCSRPPTARRRR